MSDVYQGADSGGRGAVNWRTRSRSKVIPILDAAVMALALGLAIVAGWPTYQHSAYVICAVAATVLAAGLAIVCSTRWQLKARFVWLLAVGIYFITVIPLAIGSALWSFPTNLLYGLKEAVVAPITAWKTLVTLDLPVGEFGNVLVPAFIVFGASALWLVLLQLRRPHLVGLRILAVSVPLIFVIVTGPLTVSGTVSFIDWQVTQPREATLGVVWALVMVLWLSIRRYFAAPRVKTVAADKRSRRRMIFLPAARLLAATATLLIGTIVAVGVAPTWTSQRIVARSFVAPEVVEPPSHSPLSTFRSYFAGTDLDEVLFTVSADELPSRVRIATMPSYRGDVFTAVDPDDSSSDFRRLAYRVADVPGAHTSVAIHIENYQGPWLPTVGQVVEVVFQGDSARELAAQLYVSRSTTGAIVMTPRSRDVTGLVQGDTYELKVAEPDAAGPTGRSPGIDSQWSQDELPAMYTWLETLDAPLNTVADVQNIVDRMMWASYLSHSLVDPAETWNTTAGTWLDTVDNDGFRFEPSYAGHNLRTIDEQIFHRLIDPTIRKCDGPQDTRCAAVVGDDEQFAVAAALLGQAAGFPVRVVLGATPTEDGQVRAQDIRAWAELQSADGSWTPIEAVARTDNSFDDTQTQPTPNQYSNPVKRDVSPQLPPPDVRSQSGGSSSPVAQDQPEDLAGNQSWRRVVAISGVSLGALLLLTSPIWVIVLVKLLRRKRRRRGAPEDQITGGWDEYLDRAVDMGQPRLAARTRTESATVYGGTQNVTLAVLADAAVFSDREPTSQEADDYWRLVHAEIAERRAEMGAWQRWRAKISWRFLTQQSSRVDAYDTEDN
ncbi:Transglutaminase-like superfamily protein [Micrococcales bacterium KH10]|nr:Transglutaminase-like superfamily protein [Micrococcales bacterium KH10]